MLLLIFAFALGGAPSSSWLEAVSPLLSNAEKKQYLGLTPEARSQYEQSFWSDKSITPEEYFHRLQYVDSVYGSGKTASGANTDPGRIYLSLGPPNKITRIPSSRIFVPLEIWYYESAPRANLNSELRLIFYQKNSLGLPKLYSPTLDTIRALLLPEAGTVGMFGPNNEISEADIRTNLTVGPAEDELISAAVSVSPGIKNTGNDEILGRIMSPAFMLGAPPQTEVQSRLIAAHPHLEIIATRSDYGGHQIDFFIQAQAQRQIELQILAGPVDVYHNKLQLSPGRNGLIEYHHRIDLLPGSYSAIFTFDDQSFPYSVVVPDKLDMGSILRSKSEQLLDLSPTGNYAFVTLPEPANVTWTVRRGLAILSRTSTAADRTAVFPLPTHLPPGAYSLEAATSNDSRTLDFTIGAKESSATEPLLVSLNANLKPALRFAAIAHRWLLRNNLVEAKSSLQKSLAAGPTTEATLELARIEALTGQWDSARNRVKTILAAKPDNFEALSIYAYVETKFQDYAIAAQLYRRALAVQDSPALRFALSRLP